MTSPTSRFRSPPSTQLLQGSWLLSPNSVRMRSAATDAGAVSLEASMEGARYAAAVETEGLALHQLIGTAPEASARGRVEANLPEGCQRLLARRY